MKGHVFQPDLIFDSINVKATVPHESVTIDRHISNKGYFSS